MKQPKLSSTADFKLQAQVQCGENKKIISLIESGLLSVDYYGKYVSSLLIESIKCRNNSLAESLIARGADVNLEIRGESVVAHGN